MAPSRHDGLLDLLCSHIISLSWSDELISPVSDPSSGAADHKREAFAVSAFVIAVRDIWFLVTAGHVLHDLDQRLKDYGRQIVDSHLLDGLAPGPHFPPIPFPLGSTSKCYVDSDDGNDYGLIPLSRLFEAQLRAGGIRALTESAWTDIPKTVDLYCLLGFPKQGKRIRVSEWRSGGNVSIELGIPLLDLQPTSTPPESLRCDTERFYAKVLLGDGIVAGRPITLTDIDGMSGGPIFAFKERDDGRFRYWVIAVQSSWDSGSEVLAGCLIRPLVNGLEATFRRYEADLKSLQDADKSQDAGGEDRQAPVE